jgi:hypothetical protein
MKPLGAFVLAGALIASAVAGSAQSATISQKVAQVKLAIAQNKMQLARYTWQMQETVSVNGEVKKQDLYQVVSGPGGPTKTLIAQPVAPSAGRQHGIRARMRQDFEDYAQQVGAVAQSYTNPDPAKLKALAAQGSVSLRAAGVPGYSAIVVKDYNKPGDSIVITIGGSPKSLVSIDVSSYLDQPSNPVTIQVRYASLPDGTRYAQTTTVNGVSKNLTVVDQSMNFAPRE